MVWQGREGGHREREKEKGPASGAEMQHVARNL